MEENGTGLRKPVKQYVHCESAFYRSKDSNNEDQMYKTVVRPVNATLGS